MPKNSLVSCILLAGNNQRPTFYAVELFLKQAYKPLELIVVDDGHKSTKGLIPSDRRIRYFQMPEKMTAGSKRNFACDQARGDVILHWDEEIWYAQDRITRMADPILNDQTDFCCLEKILSYDIYEEKGRLWTTTGSTPHSSSYCYRRSMWASNRFPDVDVGAEAFFAKNASDWLPVTDKTCQVVLVQKNSKPAGLPTKSTCDDYEAIEIRNLIGDDLQSYMYAEQTKPSQPDFPSTTYAAIKNNQSHQDVFSSDRPLVSCIMPTSNRRQFIPLSIEYFLRQDYPSCELIIVDDGDDPVSDLVPDDPRITYNRISGKYTIGSKRNIACKKARGEIIVHWDDDDWAAPWRLTYQIEQLIAQKADVCGIDRVFFLGPNSDTAWEYVYPRGEQPWVYGGALCYTKALWSKNPFPDINVGEDNEFVWNGCPKNVLQLEKNTFYIGMIHTSNSSPKMTADLRWQPMPAAKVRDLMGGDWHAWQDLLVPRTEAIQISNDHDIDRDTGMISPARQKIIQIELTNACPHGCSNCTRFCSHIRKPFFMDYTTFRKAVFSLQDYPGMVGIMGGEPTLHPDFEGFVEFYSDHIGPKERYKNGREPIEDFSLYRENHLNDLRAKRGLWTSLGDHYYRYYELIQEVFDYQCINDHANQGLHQALLISRKSLGISDKEWVRLRDNCWVQRLWSSSITPKGAFFCEVAAALDMLFDGPGGWPIQPGWWKRSPAEFGDQLQWCEMCSAPLHVPRRPAREKIDDVCPDNYKRLKAINAPSIRQDRVQVFDVPGYRPEDNECNPNANWYMPEEAQRIASTNRSLRIRKLEALTVCVDYGAFLNATLPANIKNFDRYVIVTSPDDKKTQKVAKNCGATLVLTEAYRQNGDAFNKGAMINEGLQALDLTDWVLFTDADVFLPAGLRGKLASLVLNPGCLYYTSRYHLPSSIPAEIDAFRRNPDGALKLPMHDPATNYSPWGYFQLFNTRARVLEGRGPQLVSEVFPSAGGVDHHFCMLWPEDKQIILPQQRRAFDTLHIPHGSLGTNWNGRNPKSAQGWVASGQLTAAGLYIFHPWPDKCYLKLTRIDTSEAVITTYRYNEPCGFCFDGFEYCAHHIGYRTGRHQVAVDRANKGKIIIQRNGGNEYSGWGLGHVMWEDNRQGYVWNGQSIAPTQFELSYKYTLSDDEKRFLELI